MNTHFEHSETLALASFKEMDYPAVEQYALPIELMMENTGLQLARLIILSVEKNLKFYSELVTVIMVVVAL